MDRSGRIDDASEDKQPVGEVVLLALVVSVMSAVKAQLESHSAEPSADDRNATLLARLPKPSPELTPEQVIRIQLSALKLDSAATNHLGIRKAFEFASQANRQITGNEDQFINLVQNPLYHPLLNFRSVRFEPMRIMDQYAEQRVNILSREGQEIAYTFFLARQPTSPCRKCWMTDGVERS